MSKSTFERAIVHQTKQIEKYTRFVEDDPRYNLQLKSARISLAALRMVQEFQCEETLMTRINSGIYNG